MIHWMRSADYLAGTIILVPSTTLAESRLRVARDVDVTGCKVTTDGSGRGTPHSETNTLQSFRAVVSQMSKTQLSASVSARR